MSYHTKIIFGKDQVAKHHNNEVFTDYGKIINLKKYIFETQEERNAFYKGLDEAAGWLEFEVVNESEDEIKKEKEDDTKFDYWAFIEKYYPNYYSCDNILLSDILTRKFDGEEICESDEEYIKDWDVRKELFELEKQIFCVAFEAFFYNLYPKVVHE